MWQYLKYFYVSILFHFLSFYAYYKQFTLVFILFCVTFAVFYMHLAQL